MRGFWGFVAKNLQRSRLLFWRLVYRSYTSRYQISPTFRFNGAGIQLYGDGCIELGDDSYISEFSTIQAGIGRKVCIGRRCSIAHNVRIYTTTSDAETDFRTGEGTAIEGDVAIGDGVWVGVNVYIGPGITIGENSVVGANAVVTKNIPPGEIWGGVPARCIRNKVSKP